jgi:hypothetical protein
VVIRRFGVRGARSGSHRQTQAHSSPGSYETNRRGHAFRGQVVQRAALFALSPAAPSAYSLEEVAELIGGDVRSIVDIVFPSSLSTGNQPRTVDDGRTRPRSCYPVGVTGLLILE